MLVDPHCPLPLVGGPLAQVRLNSLLDQLGVAEVCRWRATFQAQARNSNTSLSIEQNAARSVSTSGIGHSDFAIVGCFYRKGRSW